jgi:hypothetical protein
VYYVVRTTKNPKKETVHVLSTHRKLGKAIDEYFARSYAPGAWVGTSTFRFTTGEEAWAGHFSKVEVSR